MNGNRTYWKWVPEIKRKETSSMVILKEIVIGIISNLIAAKIIKKYMN